MGVGVVIGVAVARYLGPTRFGVYSYALAIVGLFTSAASLGLPSIVVRDLVQRPGDVQATLGTALVLQLISGLVVMLAGMALSPSIGTADPDSARMILVLCVMLAFKPSEIIKCWFESRVEAKYSVLAENGAFIFASIVRLCLIVVAASLAWFAWTAVFEISAGAIALYLIYYRISGKRLALVFDAQVAKRQLCDSWPLVISGLAILIYMRVDQIMLGRMTDSTAVGVYTAAVRLSEVWYFIPAAFLSTIGPYLIRSKSIDESKYYHRLQSLFNIMVLLSVGVAITATVFARGIVILLFGPAYAAAGTILSVHIWAGVFVSLGLSCSSWFVIENLARQSLYRTVLGAMANILLNLMLIPKYGGLGAAIATLISQALASVVLNAFNEKTRRIFYMQCTSLSVFRMPSTLRTLRRNIAVLMAD